MTVPTAPKELDKIEIIRQADGVYRLDHAVTATQKDILQSFNLTAASVKKEEDKKRLFEAYRKSKRSIDEVIGFS